MMVTAKSDKPAAMPVAKLANGAKAKPEIVAIRKSTVQMPRSTAPKILWTQKDKGERWISLNFWSESINAMLDEFPDSAELETTFLTDVSRLVLGTKMTAPLISALKDAAFLRDGGKDVRSSSLQVILLAIAIKKPEAFIYLMDDLKRRFLLWNPKVGHPSKNRLDLTGVRGQVVKTPDSIDSISALIRQFCDLVDLTEDDFVALYGRRYRVAAQEIVQGRKPTDEELYWLGAELYKPSSKGDRPYELSELQAIRDGVPATRR